MAKRKRGWSAAAAFFLIKSDVKKSSLELADAIAAMEEVEEVCFTEGKYSFLARLCGDEDALDKAHARLSRKAGILEVDRLDAPLLR